MHDGASNAHQRKSPRAQIGQFECHGIRLPCSIPHSELRKSKIMGNKVVIREISTQFFSGFRPFTCTLLLNASDSNICWVFPVNRSVVGSDTLI